MKRNLGIIVVTLVILAGVTVLVHKNALREGSADPVAPVPAETTGTVISTFSGTLNGKETHLVLRAESDSSAEGTYVLTSDGEVREGTWTTLRGDADDADATVYQLDPDGPASPRYFAVVDGVTVEELDGDLGRQQPSGDFRLTYEHAPAIRAAYPLYAGAGWNAPVELSLAAGEGLNLTDVTLYGTEIVSAQSAQTADIAGLTQGFRDHYVASLEAAGWTADPNLAADGPGSSIWGYRKGDDVLMLSYETEFLEIDSGVPVQCPCRVSFRIFAGSPLTQ